MTGIMPGAERPEIGATISAQVNIGVASGSVNATVQFLDVTLPLSASALWAFNSTPDVCQADLTFDVNERDDYKAQTKREAAAEKQKSASDAFCAATTS